MRMGRDPGRPGKINHQKYERAGMQIVNCELCIVNWENGTNAMEDKELKSINPINCELKWSE